MLRQESMKCKSVANLGVAAKTSSTAHGRGRDIGD